MFQKQTEDLFVNLAMDKLKIDNKCKAITPTYTIADISVRLVCFFSSSAKYIILSELLKRYGIGLIWHTVNKQ